MFAECARDNSKHQLLKRKKEAWHRASKRDPQRSLVQYIKVNGDWLPRKTQIDFESSNSGTEEGPKQLDSLDSIGMWVEAFCLFGDKSNTSWVYKVVRKLFHLSPWQTNGIRLRDWKKSTTSPKKSEMLAGSAYI